MFSIHTKGFDSFFTADYSERVADFRSALKAAGHVGEFQPSHVAAAKLPDTDGAFGEFDAVVLTTSTQAPSASIGDVLASPDKRRTDWWHFVASGSGLAMIGGYLGASRGIEGKANYRATPLAEVLPVELEASDDRQEVPEGAITGLTDIDHPGGSPGALESETYRGCLADQVCALVDPAPLYSVTVGPPGIVHPGVNTNMPHAAPCPVVSVSSASQPRRTRNDREIASQARAVT